MASNLEGLAAQFLKIRDLGRLDDKQKEDILYVCNNIQRLDELNEVLAVDFATYIAERQSNPDAPIKQHLEDFLLRKIYNHPDLPTRMILASRVLFEATVMEPLSPFQSDILGFLVDNLPRFNSLHISPLAPNLLVQVHSEPGASERLVSAPILLDWLKGLPKAAAEPAAQIICRIVNSSVLMVNNAEQEIVDLAHWIHLDVVAQSILTAGQLALKVNRQSAPGSDRQREASRRVLKIIETEGLQPSGAVMLARELIQQGLPEAEAPYQRLIGHLCLKLPTMSVGDQQIFTTILAGKENGIAKDPAHPMHREIRTHETVLTAITYHAYLAAQEPGLADFMPLAVRGSLNQRPA